MNLGEPRTDHLRETRANNPAAIGIALADRSRPETLLPRDGRMFILAADHPARGALGVGADPMAMADRGEMLERLAIGLSRPGVDGVLATPDVLEDLALWGALDGKIAAGSMNRGGLAGATFELDDRFTAYDIASLVKARFDFAKVLVRIDLADHGTASTLESVARAVTEAAEARVPIMIEPFLSTRVGGRVVNSLDADSVIRSVAIASGLGASSAYSWLKLPVVDEMHRVMRATTLPTLLLGGDSQRPPTETFASWSSALRLPGVRGLVVGRSLLYPEGSDVVGAIDRAAELVHADD